MPAGAVVAALLLSTAEAGPAADTGRDAFDQQCASCHRLDGVSTLSGPSLKGVMWRKIASLPGFRYSAGLRAVIGDWSPDRLNAFLKDTQGFAPGTDMFWNIRDDPERHAIVRYLESVK
jgi:cytochrome c